MKKMNKGFSMVELIIVIAIMAILAGALAPALIKYINKSRISTDIQTGNTIATAVQTALSNETGYDSAASYDDSNWHGIDSVWNDAASNKFAESVKDVVGGNSAPAVKSKKCAVKGATNYTAPKFEIFVNRANNEVKVRLDANHMVFPSAESCLTDDTATHDTTLGN